MNAEGAPNDDEQAVISRVQDVFGVLASFKHGLGGAERPGTQ